MQKNKDLTKSVIEITGNMARYALYFLVVVLTPLIAEPIAKMFDWCVLNWSEPGQLRGFFTALFTVIFWLIGMAIILSVENGFKKTVKRKTEMLTGKELTSEGAQTQTEKTDDAAAKAENQPTKTEAPAAETVKQDGRLSKEERKQRNAERLAKFKTWWVTTFQSKPVLPWRNVGSLLLITVACLLLISLQIDFQVKPFYELGDKITYSELINKGGEIVVNLVKCIWIVMMLRAALGIWQALLEFWDISHVRFLKWIGAGAMLVLFGIYDVCSTGNPFAWTYIAFYVAFTAIYYFTERSEVKTYLLTFFIYIF